ncbi:MULTISPECIES: MobV family relaxase [Alistipes]|uniref:MobV family relaxase n=1 Tax=Alistipes TaxID=239759 RepID=UPI0011C8F6B6|nr:MobV family relaxase [Alistipes senegalensis]
MGYVVLHIDKAPGNEAAMTAHIARTHMPPNAVPELTYLNEELVEFPEGVADRTDAINYRLDHAGLTRKIGTNQVRAIRIMLTGSHDDMKRIAAEGRIKEWCADNLDWLRKTYGEDNVVSAVLHLDESTPHIHAAVVPIVTGERRKVREKKTDEPGKRKYRKKSTARPRLCADDVMTRVKLKGYQDSYAEAMAKYGLQRGIDGSEARHVTTQEFYRNAIAQQQGLQDNIGELLRIEAEKREAIERASKQEQVTRDELTKTEAELKAVKGELKAERLKNSAAEVGTTIIDGIGAMIGMSKVKRQEQQIAEFHGQIGELKRENIALQKEIKTQKSTLEQIKDESEKVMQGLRSEIAHLHELMPELKGLLQVEKICQTVGFGAEMTKRIVRGESVGFKGSLYSPEHKKWLHTDHSTAKTENDPQDKARMRLTVDGIDVFGWLKRKYEEQYPRPQVKEPLRQPIRRGIKR